MNDFWKDKNVFVTGATGFIGSWLTKTLIGNGANVVVLIRDKLHKSNYFIMGLNENSTQVHGSLEDYKFLERVLNEYEIDTVFHIAAQAIVGTSNRSPLSTFEANIKGTWNVLEAARVNRLVKRVVVASSDKAYGTQPVLPYTEDMPLQGEHPYDVSKSCTDLISQCYHKTYELPVAITRCANIYGGGDVNFNRIIPGIIKAIIQNIDFLIRSDGTMERDYMYVEDAVNAYLTLAENLHRPEIQGQAFNFGTETPISVINVFERTKNALNASINAQILGQAKGEINKQYLGSQKARDLLNWSPQYNLEEGLVKTFEWYVKYKDRII